MPVVAKLAQRFFDVRTADDKDLVFSSEFPTLKEEATGIFSADSMGTTGNDVLVYEHNLKYEPFYTVFDEDGEFLIDTGPIFSVDKNRFYIRDSTSIPPTGKFRWVIYRLPLYEEFISTVSGGASIPIDNIDDQYVFKMAKQGKSVNSKDLRDFTIHSKTRTPLVHIVSPKEWTDEDGQHIVEHGLLYNPLAFGFRQLAGGKTTTVSASGQATPYIRLKQDTGEVVIVSAKASSPITSIVVFKDPFTAPEIDEATF